MPTGVTYGVLSSNALYVIVTMLVVLGGYSPLHLLWLFPVAYAAGFLILVPPFKSILILLGRIYASICCIGLKRSGASS